MTRPFTFRIHASELFTQIQPLNNDEKAAFITQFSTDLLTLMPTFPYSKQVIDETVKFIEIKRENGLKGGRPKTKTKAKVKLKETKTKAKAKVEEEVEEEKKHYADNVLLLEKEFKTLNSKYGSPFAQKCIDKLSSYKLAHNKKYDSDYGAINQWVVEAVQKTHRPDNEVIF